MKENSIQSIIIRYAILIIFSIGNLWIIYSIFSPLTTHAAYLAIKLFFTDAFLRGDIINYSNHSLQVISSCVAGAAYLLLLILNLSTPMKKDQRIKSISFLIISFFIFNIIRITIFAVLFANNYSSIDALHKFSWYFLSIAFVIILWFTNVKIFNIKSIPIYSDLRYLYNLAKK